MTKDIGPFKRKERVDSLHGFRTNPRNPREKKERIKKIARTIRVIRVLDLKYINLKL